ncbi:hypothetical protein M9435_003978 [Picochlorum sp. BPE23]|nr:hypothetical protein M9435_003978 [Picochlorum sp. BPE23]
METLSHQQQQSELKKTVSDTPKSKPIALDVSDEGELGTQFVTPVAQGEAPRKFESPADHDEKVKAMTDEAKKAEEHALLAAAKQKEIEMHHAELVSLTKEAEDLEAQSKALFEEAEEEREKVRKAMETVLQAEAEEQAKFEAAEKIEKERRQAAMEAFPKLENADEADFLAKDLTCQAEDYEFHAQILENRAKSLLSESEQMKEVAQKKQEEIDVLNNQISSALAELSDLEVKAEDNKPGDLADYILECEKELGMLQRRIIQLKEEIQWSKKELEERKENARIWERLLTTRRTNIADLKNKHYMIQMALEDAKERSVVAAHEAQMPAKMAEQKFGNAAELRKSATEATNRALEIQRQAIEAARIAVSIQKQKEAAMAEAAKAESAARQAERQAAMFEDRGNQKISEANEKQALAATMKEKAEGEKQAKENVDKWNRLDQLHPMYFTTSDLLETPPPPTTPATAI